MSRRLVIVGNGQMAELCHSQFTHRTDYRVAAFSIGREFITAGTLLGLPVVPLEELQSHFPPDTADAFVSIGPVRNNAVRAAAFDGLRSRGYRFANLISQHAVISPDARIGENVCIGHLSVVSSWCRIDDNVVIGSTCNVGHHCRIGPHAFLAGHAALAGSVVIGERAFIGTGATVRDNVTVGAGSVVGAGATILGDVEPNAVYVTERARKLPMAADQAHL
jgi:sugar O-acyltransferase (sialic acid O-acetyltransferase NeuD family)